MEPAGAARVAVAVCGEGLEGLADRSHRSASCPHQIAAEAEVRLVDLRGSASVAPGQLRRCGCETRPGGADQRGPGG